MIRWLKTCVEILPLLPQFFALFSLPPSLTLTPSLPLSPPFSSWCSGRPCRLRIPMSFSTLDAWRRWDRGVRALSPRAESAEIPYIPSGPARIGWHSFGAPGQPTDTSSHPWGQ